MSNLACDPQARRQADPEGGPVSKPPGIEPKHRPQASESAIAHRRQTDLRDEPSFEGTLT